MKKWTDSLSLGGNLVLKNRVVMAAMTRQRALLEDGVPTDLIAKYYEQRASAGLILTECAAWCPRGHGYPGAPNLYNQHQALGWSKVAKAVHNKGGKVFLQLYHAGRATHPELNYNNPVQAPSPIAIKYQKIRVANLSYPVPKEMTLEDIASTQKSFQRSIKLAIQAGFDGIQLHGANGYLIDAFLRSTSNLRKDHYGGSVENRCRFVLELCNIALKHLKPEQLGIKLSPVSRSMYMYDENPQQTFGYLLQQLDKLKIGFVQLRQSKEIYHFEDKYPKRQQEQMPDVCKQLRPHFKGVIIGNDSFTPQAGLKKINDGLCDAISFGRYYINNPDLFERIIHNKAISHNWDWHTLMLNSAGEKGYTDYPPAE